MTLSLTLSLLAASVAATVFTAWRGARPVNLVRGPRMIPWRFLMLLCATLAALLLIHVGTLLGFQRTA
jgi:hypothetical protein